MASILRLAGHLMTAGRIALPKRPSTSHWDHTTYSESDPNAAGTLPPEYVELARKQILAKAGDDAGHLLAMLGLTEGVTND